MAPSRIPSAINMTPSPPVQPFSPDGPPATNELACKSEPGEKTFAFCVADSCKGTATCEGCNSDFGIITKVKFCQDINGIKFLCVGACVARTACSTCEYDNVAKTKAFQPPWDGQVFMSPALIAKSKASPYPYPPIWIIPTLFALKVVGIIYL
ncbi:hypothetical protein Pst134EA_000290 [Puccinia striiformis f. sp. tritici]|uniref:hypothetical protein n=1 Tax=Puccinia striiformis f. sp. tritici TaxID=168172 RepID=UPI00200766F4|nr:hypothetical protein Pst134EA_000290 [Puccinia striiformis f. sp. tritici]KAH9466456.1 hypothetical protein Pst134EB_001510 [Puccinia striiformis f. sp. tritici]KAH9473216.1 hypothetical protein Pst134EA_000290 [Puccinia striiformis f. sp. tritici]KAI9603467.1 hypothetical protein KEM48_001479 [Puccinia striiformis f. sp. tritici PST-130]